MLDSRENVRMRLSINGQVVATAGVEETGLVATMLSWVRRDNVADVSLAGLDSKRSERLQWSYILLKPTDEITVEILPPGKFDEPERSEHCPPGP